VVERVVLFKTDHAARGLVPRVDILTAPGYTPELSPWQRPGRVTRLITPKCVFELSPSAAPRLASLHAGETLAEVKALTGFEFRAPDPILTTPRLTPEESAILYGPVKDKLVQAYPHFAARLQN
jgi:acyl CoA:acetate/3-ketoacid CoA transferase beta subunit